MLLNFEFLGSSSNLNIFALLIVLLINKRIDNFNTKIKFNYFIFDKNELNFLTNNSILSCSTLYDNLT